MPFVTKFRTNSQKHNRLKTVAAKQKTSVSALVEGAVATYVRGRAHLPEMPEGGVHFVAITIDPVTYEHFQEIAGKANLSINEAFLIAIEEQILAKYDENGEVKVKDRASIAI